MSISFNGIDEKNIQTAITALEAAIASAAADVVEDAIVDGVTDKAPSQNAVFDALVLKADSSALPSFFVSTEQTGSGIEQDIAHGLSSTPSYVLVSITDDNNAAFAIVEGTHDATNLKINVTASAKYKVLAIV